MSAEPKVWTVRRLRAAVDGDDENGVRVRLPHFQRSVVWDSQQKEMLISSLLRGFPVGSLLLYEQDTKNYLLVDGLQRTTAIREYAERPLAFLPAAQLPELPLLELESRLAAWIDGELESIQAVIMTWLRKTATMDHKSGYDSLEFLKYLAENYGLSLPELVADTELTSAISRFLDELEKSIDVSARELPVVVYSGKDANLPEIFELLNSQGTELGKYDMFAATWVNQETEVVDQVVRDAIREKYRFLVEVKGYEISGVGPNLEIDSYSLFEYLFGLGKVLSTTYPLLFQKGSSPADPDSIGFTLATVVHRLRLGEMRGLPGHLRTLYKSQTTALDLRLFQAALHDACSFVEKTLTPYIGIKLNRRDGKPLLVHTEYQICSLIASALALKYDVPTWSTQPDWEECWRSLKSTIPQHYLHDILLQSWRGSGDTRLFSRVWEKPNDDSPLQASKHYLRPIGSDDWDRVLDTWLAQQLQKSQFERGHIDATQKVFLSFLYSSRIDHNQLHKNSFEIEHLVPVSRIAAFLKDRNAQVGWPISAIGNLALFTQPLNREKSARTLPEYLDAVEESQGVLARQKMTEHLERLLFCSPWQAVIAEDKDVETAGADYLDFVKHCFAEMKSELMDVLEVDA